MHHLITWCSTNIITWARYCQQNIAIFIEQTMDLHNNVRFNSTFKINYVSARRILISKVLNAATYIHIATISKHYNLITVKCLGDHPLYYNTMQIVRFIIIIHHNIIYGAVANTCLECAGSLHNLIAHTWPC